MMLFLDRTFEKPEENLACDEFLVEFCRRNEGIECLRFWEPRQYFVVLGYGNKLEEEIYLDECRRQGIPILRRISGGGCVLQGPGCLNYSLVLNINNNLRELATIPAANRYVMNRNRRAIASILGEKVKISGITDLTIDGKKFSGNAQRRFNDFVLYHGSFLLNMSIEKIESLLKIPPRQPCYRHNRTHKDFLININLPSEEIKRALRNEWDAIDVFPDVDLSEVTEIARLRYSNQEWNLKY